MTKIEEAQNILKALGLPTQQQNEMAALTLLALCRLSPTDAWPGATRNSLTITKGIMDFVEQAYDRHYAPNTRETFRRHVLHQFVQAGLVALNPDASELPTNSPKTHYALTEPALRAIQLYGTACWQQAAGAFLEQKGSLQAIYQRSKSGRGTPLRFPDGAQVMLSPGQHNRLQAAILEQFASHFSPDAYLLYLGDTAKKTLYKDTERLADLGVHLNDHDKLPDIVLYDAGRKRLFLVEAVTSHGPVTPKRRIELAALFSAISMDIIFVTGFLNLSDFRKHITKIAWETEVWIADAPDHLIHFNGDHFLTG